MISMWLIVQQEEKEDKLKASSEIIYSIYSERTKENEMFNKLIAKYSSPFAREDDPPSVSPFLYHTIQL